MRLPRVFAQSPATGALPLSVALLLLGFTIPISIALDNLLLGLVLLPGILFNGRTVWQIVTHNPVARAAWLLFGALLIGACYGATPWRESFGYLAKYDGLAFVPLFMLLLSRENTRRWGQYVFLASMGLTLLLSYLVGLDVLPVQSWMNRGSSVDDPVVFLSHIAQNDIMAFATFLALLQLRQSTSLRGRAMWGIFAVLALVDVLFLVKGRTGYLIMLVLLGWFIWTTLQRHLAQRGIACDWRHGIGVMLILSGLVVSLFFASPRLHERLSQVGADFQQWKLDNGKATSTGERLDFYYNTLQIVRQQPWLGVGTGGYTAAFAKQTRGMQVVQESNPHNEYLMMAVQTGAVGLVLMLYLFYTEWRYAPLLETPFAQDAARGLVLAYLVNCTFNCALRDHADGLVFSYMTALLFANLKVKKLG